jgi:aminoglycoside/choline kinase family phosphotransferase/dTDP-glucose pyrophosphorylase
MQALILAAGLGTRLRPYTDHTPKALFTINQQPLLGRAIEALHHAGCDRIIVNTHHLHTQIEAYAAAAPSGTPIIACHEEQILGTGGAIRNIAGHWLTHDLLVVNADIVHDIDLAGVYRFHRSHDDPVTLVMHDVPEFNTVCVDADDFVTGFQCRDKTPDGQRSMAFTGIHVIDRCVLDFLPQQGPAHIIDAYQRMLANGARIKALVVQGHYWQDIGTPERYQAAAFDQMAPLAFQAAFGHRPERTAIRRRPLQGDGSDRRWYRLEANGRTLIMVDHGIRLRPGQQEVDAYVDIGRHLIAKGISAPRIFLHDGCAGLVFVEDWGDVHLQTLVGRSGDQQRQQLYYQVIDQWTAMAVACGPDFDRAWTFQTAVYDRGVILDRECRYFVEAFIQAYLGWPQSYDDLRDEFERLADEIIKTQIEGFLHRDFQSRNIMICNGRVGIIDFQAGRLGPIQYDLAALLIDPYAALPEDFQDQLRAYAMARLQKLKPLDPEKFLRGYEWCAVSRNLQILGAFAFLSRSKGKRQFEVYIPTAVRSLVRNLSRVPVALPKLIALADRAAAHFAQMPCDADG